MNKGILFDLRVLLWTVVFNKGSQEEAGRDLWSLVGDSRDTYSCLDHLLNRYSVWGCFSLDLSHLQMCGAKHWFPAETASSLLSWHLCLITPFFFLLDSTREADRPLRQTVFFGLQGAPEYKAQYYWTGLFSHIRRIKRNKTVRYVKLYTADSQ